MAGNILLLGILMFIVGLFIKNKKLKRILVYGGLSLSILVLIVFFDEIKGETIDAINAGKEAAGKNKGLL